jgi:hypothetical protein
MKTKIFTTAALAVLFVLGIGGAIQHISANQAPKADSTQGQSNSGMMGGGMMGQGMGQDQGMMGRGMMGMMGQMNTHHQQMTGLMNKIMEGMAAIQSEKDPEALKSKLAEHQKLLDQMRAQMMQQGNRMQMMSGQVKQQCPGSADSSKAPTK